MTISRINSATAPTTTVPMPTGRAVGDLEIMWAFRSASATPPTVPSGWITVATGGANTCSRVLAYRWCTSASDTSGTWTNATQLVCVVYRGVLGLGATATSAASGTSISYPGLTPIQNAGDSWIVGFGGHRTASNVSTAPTGMTLITSVGTGPQVAAFDTNAGVSSWSTQSVTVNASSGHESDTLELLADASTLNPYDKSSTVTLSSANMTATVSGGTEVCVRGSLGRNSGLYIFAFTPTVADLDHGLANTSFSLTNDPGADNNSFSFWMNGGNLTFSTGGSDTTLGSYTLSTTSPSYIAADLTNQLVWFKSGAGTWNASGAANPDTGVGGKSISNITGPLFPVFGVYSGAVTYDGTASGNPTSTAIAWNGSGATTTTITQDWASGVEVAQGINADAVVPMDRLGLHQRDAAAPAHHCASVLADGILALELASRLLADGPAPITMMGALAVDSPAPVADVGALQVDIVAPTEASSTLSTDRAAGLETAFGLRADQASALAVGSNLLVDEPSGISTVGVLRADLPFALENGATLAIDRSAGLDTAITVQALSCAPAERAAAIASDYRAPIEFAGSAVTVLSADSAGLIEFGQVAQRDLPAPIAWSALLARDAPCVADWLGALQRDGATVTERSAALSTDLRAFFEGQQALARDLAAPADAHGAFCADTHGALDFLAPVLASMDGPISHDGAVVVDCTASADFATVVFGDLACPFDFTGTGLGPVLGPGRIAYATPRDYAAAVAQRAYKAFAPARLDSTAATPRMNLAIVPARPRSTKA